jgi:ABC-type glucose/galactose transport system permease subunit
VEGMRAHFVPAVDVVVTVVTVVAVDTVVTVVTVIACKNINVDKFLQCLDTSLHNVVIGVNRYRQAYHSYI